MEASLPPFQVTDVVQSLSEVQGWGLMQAKVPETWKVTRGSNINIMILDSGYSDHEDLKDCIVGAVNFVDNDDKFDKNGHSTAVCSIIGARENGQGMVGVAPESKIFCVKVLDSQGIGQIPAIYKGLRFCLEAARGNQQGVFRPDLIVTSLGTESALPDFIYDIIKELYKLNIPIIAAAGNSGGKMSFPARYKEVISVGSVDKDGKVSKFSSRGEDLDFAAPGSEIYAAFLNNSYKLVRGTSFSGPFFAGIIALLLSKHKIQEAATGKNDCKTIPQIRAHLIRHALQRLNKSSEYGYGLVDANNLISDPDNDTLELEPTPVEKPKNKKWWQKILRF